MSATLVAPEHRAAFERQLERSTPPWLRSLRQAAFDRFEALGIPSSKDEAWRYTDPKPFGAALAPPGEEPASIPRAEARAAAFDGLRAHELVFVDGIYAPALSSLQPLPPGVRAQSLLTLLAKNPESAEGALGQVAGFDHHAFTALNTALFSDGAYVETPRGLVLPIPIHLVFLASGRRPATAQRPRILVRAGPESHLQLIESYVGPSGSPHLTSAVAEYLLGPGSRVERYKVQREPETAHHLQAVAVEQERASVFVDHNIAVGGKTARTDLDLRFVGEGAEATLNGLYLVNGERHVDNHTFIDHAHPHCTSREFYKGILDGHARGVFYGKVLVRAAAQKTNASQTNKNLLLSDGAIVDSTPALEINADDVKCSHGSTIGQLDRDALFYLRSRGIEEPMARSLLTYGFARDIIAQLRLEPVRRALDTMLLTQLPRGRAVKEALHDAL